jgi:hypothetical protein
MKSIKNYIPREGDVVLLRARVKYDFGPADDPEVEQVWFRLEGDYQDRRLPLDRIQEVVERQWQVGDKVRSVNDHEDCGEVIAIHERMAWVKHLSGSFLSYPGLDLEFDPVENPKPIPVAAPECPPSPEISNPQAKIGLEPAHAALVREREPLDPDAVFADEHARSVAFQEAGDSDTGGNEENDVQF